MKTDKQKFLTQLVTIAGLVVQLTQQMQLVDWQYGKMNYGAGNANQITDAEASAIGATAADVSLAVTAVEAILAPLLTSGYIVAFFKLAGRTPQRRKIAKTSLAGAPTWI